MKGRIERWMDRHRGTRGLFGWIVVQLDIRELRRWVRVASQEKARHDKVRHA